MGSFQNRNLLTAGSRVGGSQNDVLEAGCGPASGMWKGFQPFLGMVGRLRGQGAGGHWGYFIDNWLETSHGGAGTALAAIDSSPGFLRVVTRATADGDGYSDQFADRHGTPTVSEIFLPVAGFNTWFECRFRCDNVADDAQTKARWWLGLCPTNTDINNGQVDGVFLRKDSGDAQIDLQLSKNSTPTSATNKGTFANNTWITVGFKICGLSCVEMWVNGAKVYTETTVSNLIDDEELALSFEFETSEAAAVTADVQHICAYQEAY